MEILSHPKLLIYKYKTKELLRDFNHHNVQYCLSKYWQSIVDLDSNLMIRTLAVKVLSKPNLLNRQNHNKMFLNKT